LIILTPFLPVSKKCLFITKIDLLSINIENKQSFKHNLYAIDEQVYF